MTESSDVSHTAALRLRLLQMSSRLDPWVVRAAATLRLPDLVAAGADTTSELAAQSGTDPNALGRLMRHLRLLGLFRTTAGGHWELTELGELLRDGHPMGLRRTLDQTDHYVRKVDRIGYGLLEAVRTGGAVWEKLHGLSFWDNMSAETGFGECFDAQMAHHAACYSPAITRGYDWSTVKHVVDVGGGMGRTLANILGAHPHLRGTLVDLPGPVANAAAVLEQANVLDRCVVVAQSFFDPLPPGSDVYLLVNTLHDWNDERSATILRRCAEAAGPGGRVLLAERVVTDEVDEAEQAFVSGRDLYMLLINGGQERSEEEFRQLGEIAGLRHTATHALVDYPSLSLVEYIVGGSLSSTDDNPSATEPAETPPAARLIQMVQGAQVTQIVATVARLGLADQLAEGPPRSSAELAGATGADPDGLTRLLRAATTVGLITETEPDQFTLTALGACLATHAQPPSLRDLAILMASPGVWLPYGHLFDAVMTGRPTATATLGMGIWDYYQENPTEDAIFARAMGSVSTSVSTEVAGRYDATRFTRIVDVGGSQGVLLTNLLQTTPQATGVLFDRPEVIDEARPIITAGKLAERIELVGGDFLTEVPPGGDLYVLKSVLHNWDDAHALRILTNCHRAAQPGSTLLVVEDVVPTEPEPSQLHLINLFVLVQTGGRKRTREQHQALLEAAGYQLKRVIPPPSSEFFPMSLFEAHRP